MLEPEKRAGDVAGGRGGIAGLLLVEVVRHQHRAVGKLHRQRIAEIDRTAVGPHHDLVGHVPRPTAVAGESVLAQNRADDCQGVAQRL